MTHVEPLSIDDFLRTHPLPPGRSAGSIRNSERTMARRPELLTAFSALAKAAFTTGTLSPELKNLTAIVASQAAGCLYCQAHRVHAAAALGTDGDRIAAVWRFESSDLFDERERAALRYAQAAAVVPNAVSEVHLEELRRHFDDGEIVELTGVIATMGFLNRWNDSLATGLEAEPLATARATIAPLGWDAGKHGAPAGR